ncbi:hypothetical protein MILUP08_42296 [Micromonospora lupini str. Lupac 08]|uniref:Uncharacterized protein n=1 Tax=Micromonospora lupini str. Lupac 08 TaxID=1150864 RepID=I0L0M8_9ACTN|nr:hypothetical protein MILUP08_42296 [Micromonospora lupini str. Lupac 08]
MALATESGSPGGRAGRLDPPGERTSRTGENRRGTWAGTDGDTGGHRAARTDMIDKLGLWAEPPIGRSA